MLVRAARRASSRQLYCFHSEAFRTRDVVRSLRCVAVTSRPFSSSNFNPSPVPPTSTRHAREPSSIASERSYNTATALSESPEDLSFLEYSPPNSRSRVEQLQRKQGQIRSSRSYLADKADTSNLIILNTPELYNDEPSIKRYNPFNSGLATKKEDLLATFRACVKIGNIERAEVMLNRLSQIENDSAKDNKEIGSMEEVNMLETHNVFLAELLRNVKALSKDERQPTIDKINKWYSESMVRVSNLSGNARTFAILMETAYYENLGEYLKTERKWKQYISDWRAQDAGPLGDVLKQDVLSQKTLQAIFNVCNINPEEIPPEQRSLFDENVRKEPNPRLQVPEVAATKVSGHGLEAVKQSLRSFTDPDFIPSALIFNTAEEARTYNEQRQKLLEEDAYEAAVKRWQSDHEALQESGVVSFNPGVKPMLWEWHKAMVPLIKEEFARVDNAMKNSTRKIHVLRCLYGPFLQVLPAEKLAAITIMTLLRQIAVGDIVQGMKTAAGVIAVGKAVEYENIAEELKKKEDDAAKSGSKPDRQTLSNVKSERDLLQYMRRKEYQTKGEADRQNVLSKGSWSAEIRAKVGSVLTSLLLHAAKVSAKVPEPTTGSQPQYVQQPAFYHTYQYILGKRVGVIKVHPELVAMLGTENLSGALISKQLPMLVEPLPWRSWNNGAYYFTPSRVMRYKESLEQALYCKEASYRGDLKTVFAGLDVLGATQWCINQEVFKIVLEVWNSGEKFADIPAAAKDNVAIPDPPDKSDIAARAKYVREVKTAATERQNNHSQRCDVNFKMEIARAFFHEKFYFPHNIDFRGRAYPVPPHLNHMGNDLCRGLLKFGESKPLGEQGLKWLKIHLANLCGFDKASLSDREQYTMQHLEEVFDSARNPLTGNRWWLKSEDPWQCLAACKEVEAALNSPDPIAFQSNLAVHQDGTCNGLQHYAALGGDMAGAKEVNLEPSNKPQDVYTGVAELVKESVKLDVDKGMDVAIKILPHINRKVVKQTVMTNVYGVTFIGAKAQVTNRLKEIDAIDKDDIPRIAMYLTKKIFTSLNTMFTGAHHIQTWFGECARRIAKSIGPSQFPGLKLHADNTIPIKKRGEQYKTRGKVEFMSSVVWTTPLKLPVVQPYRQQTTMVIKTNLQNISISDPTIISQVNYRKQMSAFPPNFIHSLDASHMILCALRCKEAGLQFAAVHDSFWTHASDVDMMNLHLRDAFIDMHSRDIVGDLRGEFETRYAGYKTLLSISESEPLARDIVKLRRQMLKEQTKWTGKKKASFTAVEELDRELLRDRLVASEDPEERARGEEMITPAALVKKYGWGLNKDADQLVNKGFGEVGLQPKSQSNTPTITEEIKFKVKEDDLTDVMGDVNAVPKIESVVSVDTPVHDDDVLDDEMMADVEDEEILSSNKMETSSKKKGVIAGRMVLVWVDLQFPPVPEKGTFEVSRLKGSQYFFS